MNDLFRIQLRLIKNNSMFSLIVHANYRDSNAKKKLAYLFNYIAPVVNESWEGGTYVPKHLVKAKQKKNR